MNSKTEKTQQQQVSLSDQNLKLHEALAQMGAFVAQLQRTLFQAVQAAGGQVTLDEKAIHPLWRLDKKREDGKLVLTSSITPPPTADQIDTLVAKLVGTALRIEEVQDELGLGDWPPDYLAFQLRDKITVLNGKWESASLARGLAGGNENN